MKVAFLGMGRMGRAMAAHVLDAGHELAVWNRTPGRADELLARGAAAAETPAAAADGADALVLMLFGPDDAREALLGPSGAAGAAAKGTLVVNATTVSPAVAAELAEESARRGLRYLDAPVTGSVKPAADGTLGVLVGGAAADVEAARPLLELWADPEKIRFMGDAGSGSAAKLIVNLALGVVMGGVGEALRLGHHLGLDRAGMLDVLSQGPVGFTVTQKRQLLESGDYAPPSFSLELMAKDLGLCLDAGVDLPVTEATYAVVQEAITAGHGGDDYSSFAGYVAFEGHVNSQ
ncbi:MAG: NAD(P)-dependent oxidoreductase [Actinomycetota bacterium]|nr:NAD(P)-dependent oxidoreductase [Actinomycetota bacterium]